MTGQNDGKNLILAAVLTMLVVFGWMALFPPEPPIEPPVSQTAAGDGDVPAPVGDGEQAEIVVAFIRLRVSVSPGFYFIRIDQHIAVFDPGLELGQLLRIFIFRDAAIEAVIPIMDAANQIVILVNMSIRH